jgi:hypothetical protein
MSTALAQRREFSPEFGQRVTVTKTSLAISAELTRDEWENLGEQLGEVGDSTAWWIGDWINAGERNYGEKYTRAEEVTGLDYGTLRNYAHGASRFDLSHRNDKLSFRHHRELEQQYATEDELAERRAEFEAGGLRRFARQAWLLLEPRSTFVPNWHIDVICEHLELAFAGEIRGC